MLLHLSTWQEVEAYLQRSQAVIIPIGSTEQHGPTGLIGTDFICAEAIAHGVSNPKGPPSSASSSSIDGNVRYQLIRSIQLELFGTTSTNRP